MATYSMNQLRVGLKIMVDGDPCVIVDTDFVKPGKGQAFCSSSARTSRPSGSTSAPSSRPSRSTAPTSSTRRCSTSTNDGEMWYFMDPDTFEQIGADAAAVVGDAAQWMKEEDICQVTLFDGNPIVVTPPNFVVLEDHRD